MWGGCEVDLGSIWGRCGVDVRCRCRVDVRSMSARCRLDVGSMCGRCVRHIRLAEISVYTGFFVIWRLPLLQTWTVNIVQRYSPAIMIFDGTKMNIVQTETLMARSVLRQRNLVMPMRHPSHPVKAWGRTRPMMMRMRIPKMKAVLKTFLTRKTIPELHWSTRQCPRCGISTNKILQDLLIEGHDESKAKEDAFAFRKELGDVHMDNLTWMTVIWKSENLFILRWHS